MTELTHPIYHHLSISVLSYIKLKNGSPELIWSHKISSKRNTQVCGSGHEIT